MQPENRETDDRMKEASYERIGPTAWLVAYRRTFTDIPYSREIFDELERLRQESGNPKIPAELKKPELAPQIEARYKLVDRLLQGTQSDQILEIAAGLSSRGLVASEDPAIQYVEVDLSGMIGEKRKIAKRLIRQSAVAARPNLHFEKGNALSLQDLINATAHFRAEKPIAVVNEGLLRYLNFEEKATVGRNVHALLEKFGGAWITPDITLRKILQNENTIMQGHIQRISKLTGRNIDQNRFENEDQAREFFEKLGFTIERHSFLEVSDQLVSPERLHLSPAEVAEQIGSAVVFIMRPRK